jgi:LysM repeat protein
VRGRDWTHYAAPAAFLLAVTVAVLLVRSALDAPPPATTSTLAPLPPRKTVRTTPAGRPRKKPATAPRFYTVAAGDTFEVISSKTGVPVARIQQLNPKVQSTALYIGEKLRLR